jgi:hypothetical protein
VNRRKTMNKLTMFVLAAVAAATVAIGALAAAPSASATNDGEPIQYASCSLTTRFGLTFVPHGTVITVVDAKGNEKKYKCNNGVWVEVKAFTAPTRTYLGSLSTVVTRV